MPQTTRLPILHSLFLNDCSNKLIIINFGRIGDPVASDLTFYSDEPSSNSAELYNLSVKLRLKKYEDEQKEAGFWPFMNLQFFSEKIAQK